MSNVNTDGLPPEMQQRIAQIIEGAKQKAVQAGVSSNAVQQQQGSPDAVAPSAPAAPPARVPSLMDHSIAMRQEINALRQEVASLSQQLNAVAQVVDACGQAVGQLYATFQATTAPSDPSATYSSQFQDSVTEDDY